MNQITSIARSGPTPYRVLINQEASLLRVKLIGYWAYRDAKAFWAMVLREAGKRGLKQALVMFQLSEPLSVKQAVELVNNANKVFDEQDVCLAAVDSNQRSFKSHNFWEMTVTDSFESKMFTNQNEAESWLEEQ